MNTEPEASHHTDDLREDTGETETDESRCFRVNTGLIQQVVLNDQGSELQNLGLSVFNQDEFEQGVMRQVDQALAREEAERLKNILLQDLASIEEDLKLVQDELSYITKSEKSVQQQPTTATEKAHHQKAVSQQKENKLKTLKVRQKMTLKKLHKMEEDEREAVYINAGGGGDIASHVMEGLNGGSEKESEKDRLIRQGEMTPFGTVMTANNQEHLPAHNQFLYRNQRRTKKTASPSSTYLAQSCSSIDHAAAPDGKRLRDKSDHQSNLPCKSGPRSTNGQTEYGVITDHEANDDVDVECSDKGDSDFEPSKFEQPSDSGSEEEEWEAGTQSKRKWKQSRRKQNAVYRKSDGEDDFPLPSRQKRDHTVARERDDADESYYMKRLRLQQLSGSLDDDGAEDEEFEGGLVVPGTIWKKLYKYQKTGVRWLWELHCQQAGGIIGDEMGLGKTFQMIAFLAALGTSKLRCRDFPYVGLGPVIVVCPTTVMHQWVKEFHTWWPEFRVAVLHSSGTYTGSEAQLVRSIVKSHGVLVTSYNTLVIRQDIILPYNWHYIVLDEGHKIRNPDVQVTLCCKQFRTPHRIILSGSPIQNNLKELWSLFDFIFPGKLGTLPDFMAHFSVPIVQGGYASATQVQVETAYKCVCVLRDTINPYLLRRMKADVKVSLDLPDKNEQVLFCRLTDEQREVYVEYLQSRECQAILAGKFQVFAGLITLRKICNHPDLSTGGPRVLVGQDISGQADLQYGYWHRSGKMIVVEALLKLWHQQGQRVLLFTQSRAMLDIIENFVQEHQYTYLRMDGATAISSRQPLVSQYNKDPSIFLFLLTTRVGGLGVNLTGANRVIIYDPDWNPSTDTQARERAWRIGQKRQVTVYRLLTSGTIEEKIYHRQIFKQFLTNRVLKDPRQRRFFKSNDIFELFTLGSKDERGTETSAIFAGTGSDVRMPRQTALPPRPTSKALKPNRFDKIKKDIKKPQEDTIGHCLDSSELDRMRRLARKLSQKMEQEKQKKQKDGEVTVITNTAGLSKECTNTACYKSEEEPPGKCRKLSTDEMAEVSMHHARHKTTKKKKDAKFEGHRIPHLVKSCRMIHQAENKKDETTSRQQDDYVLQKLFKKTGIQGVMKHDKIMDSGRADYALVEAEAMKVAKEAAAALKHSRATCMPAISGVPTWTGQHGGSHVKPRFGLKKNSLLLPKPDETSPVIASTSFTQIEVPAKKSKDEREALFDGSRAGSITLSSSHGVVPSSELLSQMHKRQQLSTVPASRNGAEDDGIESTGLDPKDQELVEDIRNFIAFMGDTNGQASTQELISNFGPRLPRSDSAKFKAMLLQICDFSKAHGVGVWRLKQEFR